MQQNIELWDLLHFHHHEIIVDRVSHNTWWQAMRYVTGEIPISNTMCNILCQGPDIENLGPQSNFQSKSESLIFLNKDYFQWLDSGHVVVLG